MEERSVAGFRPSTNGFPWPNAWPHVAPIRIGLGPLAVGIGDAARGLCGGMVFAVADLAAAGVPTPPDPQPAPGTARFRYVVRRQVESFDWLRLPLRFLLAMVSRRWRARETAAAIAATRVAIDEGRPAMLGLVRVASPNPLRVTGNHQVLAWRYAADDGRFAIGIYDPNHPGDDSVELRLTLGPGGLTVGTLAQSTGEPLIGLLRAPYGPTDPRPFRR